jgi:hypothetical protein
VEVGADGGYIVTLTNGTRFSLSSEVVALILSRL